MIDCIFCKIAAGAARSWKVYEDKAVYAFLDIHPVAEYHTLVVPKRHFENIFDVPEQDLIDLIKVVRKLANLYQDRLGIHHVQIINSSGSEAQQDVFHLHFHIVPRQKGDGQNVRWTTHPDWVDRFDSLFNSVKITPIRA